MNTQNPNVAKPGGHKHPAGSDRWAASLKDKHSHYRCFDVTTPERSFAVEYYGRGTGNERVLVDGHVAGRSRSAWWYTPQFRFRLGSADAVLAVRFWPWLTVRWLKLIVDGRIMYSEGSAGQELSVGELLALLSDLLASEGIQVTGKPLPVPTNVVCAKQAGRIMLSQRRFSWTSVLMMPLCVLFDTSVVGTCALTAKGDLAILALMLLLPGILLAAWASYYTLARLVNRTLVTLTTDSLSIRHGPLPWPGNRSLRIQHVQEFCCEKHASRDYTGEIWESYTLSVILDDGRKVELPRKIGSPGAVRLLEQQAMGWLATGAPH